MSPRALPVFLAVVAMAAPVRALAQTAGARPLFSYLGDWDAVAAGGRSSSATYAHALAAGFTGPIGGGWSWTVQGAWTAGANLSARAIGDVQGVQGPFNTGDGLWLYEAKASYQSEAVTFQVGRLSAGDALPGAAGMGQFVNSAFSSNGGAITLNDPGRAATPAATWGAWGTWTGAPVELRGGALLSDPRRTTLARHGVDLGFHPADGVLGFGEAVAPVGGGFRAGLGGYGDSARFQTFDGRTVRGNGGWYLWLERPAAEKGESLSGFAMLQAAPRRDRSLEPLFLMGGITWQGFNPARPSDSVSLGATSGEFSRTSPFRGHESLIEANYRWAVNEHLGFRPDVQWVISPGGKSGGRNALVVGVQLEAGL